MRPKINKAFKIRTESFGNLIYLAPNLQPLVVNSVGKRIIELCDGNNDSETIVEILSKEFDEGAGKIKNDFEDFIEILSKIELIELVE